MQRAAKTAEEERGVNILFLALGFLRWYEDEESDVPRDAPLILLPVYLGRDAQRSTFYLKLREDDIATNQALQKRLRGDFGLALPDVAKTEDWQPSRYFDAVANAFVAKRRWSIHANAIELGFYSFAKQLMMRDLEPGNWPDNALVSHPLVRGLLGEGFAAEPPVAREAARLAETLNPADLIHVVDADSSQTRVIEAVRAGHNLVVQGPPGTGKSQTITNIIAAAVHDGQTVLFVAEKMATLNVVYDRLSKVGLDDICLDLHSRAANKRLVAERLDRALQAADGSSSTDETARHSTAARDHLNDAAKRLHAQIGDTGMTPYRALSIQIAAARRGLTPDARLVEEAALWTGKEFAEKARLIERLADLTESVGLLNRHVYVGVRRRSALQPADFQRQIPKLQALAGKVAALAAYATMVTNYFGLPSDPTLAGVKTSSRSSAPYRICRAEPKTSPPRSPPPLRRAEPPMPPLSARNGWSSKRPISTLSIRRRGPISLPSFARRSPKARRSGSPGPAKPTGKRQVRSRACCRCRCRSGRPTGSRSSTRSSRARRCAANLPPRPGSWRVSWAMSGKKKGRSCA